LDTLPTEQLTAGPELLLEHAQSAVMPMMVVSITDVVNRRICM
jgi:hypothetical protein